jgi:hypothetical protein
MVNKYQEALGFLKESAYENYLRHYVQTSKEKVTLFKSSEALQELVDKATPHKLLKNGLCKCGARVLVSFQDYCTQCGQAIDWSEE